MITYSADTAFQVLVGHEDVVQCCAVADDERLVVSGGRDRLLIVWKVETGDMLHSLSSIGSPVAAVAVTNDASVAFSGKSSTI